MPVANTHSRWVNGALVYYDGNDHRKSWLDAMGSNVVKYINDFLTVPYTTAVASVTRSPEWIITLTTAGSDSHIQSANLTGGALRLSPGKNEDDGIDMQLRGEDFSPKTNCPLYFGVRYKCASTDAQSDFIIGLAEHETALVDGTSHGIFFATTDAGTYVKLHVVKDVTTDKTSIMTTDMTSDTWHTDEFLVSSSSLIECWHDGTQMTSVTAGIPTTDMAVSIAFEAGAANSSHDLYIDWIRCIQINDARTTE